MKKLALLFSISGAIFLASCGDTQETASHDHHDHEMEQVDFVYDGPIDPVCGMRYDEAWTLSSEYEGTTVWFCAESCKEDFDANPEEYADKIVSVD